MRWTKREQMEESKKARYRWSKREGEKEKGPEAEVVDERR